MNAKLCTRIVTLKDLSIGGDAGLAEHRNHNKTETSEEPGLGSSESDRRNMKNQLVQKMNVPSEVRWETPPALKVIETSHANTSWLIALKKFTVSVWKWIKHQNDLAIEHHKAVEAAKDEFYRKHYHHYLR